MSFYNEKVIDHFRNPQNMGVISSPDGVGRVGNPVCGDTMHLYIKVNRDEVIEEIKFQTFGCVAAISASSAFTTLVKGKRIEDALKIGKQDVVALLGGLPENKIHCSLLAIEAFAKSVEDYLSKR